MPITVSEFSQRIKEKYPQYRDVDDSVLAARMVEKYPQYKDTVSFGPGRFFSDMSMSEIGAVGKTIGKAVGNEILSVPKGFASGFASGATSILPEALRIEYDRPLEGSIHESAGEKYGKPIGKFLGYSVPFMAAEATGGAMLAGRAAKAGVGLTAQGAARAMGTGATIGLAEDIKDKSYSDIAEKPMETVGSTAGTGVLFAPVGAAGAAFQYLRRILGGEAVDQISNLYFKTEGKVAERLAEKGEESLGMQAIKFKGRGDDYPLRGMKSRKEVLSNAKRELALLRNEGRGIIDTLNKKAITPNVPDTGIKGTPLLTYSPTKIVPSAEPLGFRGSKLPPGMGYVEPKVGTIGGIEETGLRTAGAPKDLLGRFQKGRGEGKFTPEPPTTGQKGGIPKLGQLPEHGFTGIKQGPSINIADLAGDLDSEIVKLEKLGKKTGPAKGYKRIKEDFIKSNEPDVNIGNAIELKTTLDKIVNEAYNKNILDRSQADKVYSTLANGIRKRVYAQSPELGLNFDRQALLHDVIGSLGPTQAFSGTMPWGGFWRTIGRAAFGNRIGLGAATALHKGFSTESKYVAPSVKRALGSLAVGSFDEE